MEETTKPTMMEKMVVLGIFGTLAIYSLVVLENVEAAAGFATSIAVYYLSREGT